MVLLVAIVLATQADRPAAGQQTPRPMFRSVSRLIVIPARVTGPDGKPVEGLRPEDFTLTEDGRPQSIAFVELERLDAPPAAPAAASARPALAPGSAMPSATEPTIAVPHGPGAVTYHDRRLLVFYFDLSAMPLFDQSRAIASALKYVDTQMMPADVIAVMTFQAGAVRVRQDFTGDRARLRDVIEAVAGTDETGDTPADDRAATSFGQGDDEFRLFNTDRQLSALQSAALMLAPLVETKTLIYFGSRLRLNGVANQAQLSATINAAIRANVTINPIDTRGLVATAPLGDATRPSAGGASMFSGELAQTLAANAQRAQDTLYALAKDTGGEALFDYNDLSRGIITAARAVGSHYLLGYYSDNTAKDGRFRRVRVTLRDTRRGDVTYRQGYFAEKTFGRFTAAEKERQLEEALQLEDPVTEIPMAAEIAYFQITRAEYYVPVAVKIPASELLLAEHGGGSHTVMDFIGEVKDTYGVTYANVRDKLELDFGAATAAGDRPVQYQCGLTLLPGTYVVKLLVRNATTGRIGTFQTSFTIPNLEREDSRLPISSVVLASQRVPVRQALARTQSSVAAAAVDPLLSDGEQLLPSITRVFRAAHDLYVFLQAYRRDGDPRPLAAYVSLYRQDVKVLETAPVAIQDATGRAGRATVPIRLTVPLTGVTPGTYECQISVFDADAGKAAFWRAPIAIVP